MKKHIFLIVLIVCLPGAAFAEHYFSNQPLSALSITQVNAGAATAQVTAAGAGAATVHIGDTLGQDAAAVVAISDLFVTVQTGQGKTKIPVIKSASQGRHCIGFN